jgi:uncharacterized protein (DUF1015 family)
MPHVHPFRAVRYATDQADISSLVAPPYDVLDADAKRALLARSDQNIVAVDLPHLPAKEAGPPEVYRAAAELFDRWLEQGVLRQEAQPLMAVYRQTWTQDGRTLHRTGMFCTLDLVPFGPRPHGGVLPHEQTFSGPRQDRLALMRATRAQLSPIFGLHPDAHARAARLLADLCSAQRPDLVATTPDQTRHELRLIRGQPLFDRYAGALLGEDVFIADGHHRYTTALSYLDALSTAGAPPEGHPARRCMFVLVPMSDPGLVIWPTHRVLGGMAAYSLEALRNACRDRFTLRDVATGGDALQRLEAALAEAARGADRCVLGFYDFATATAMLATPVNPDPLAERFADKPRAWRTLDVAIVQHALVEAIAQPLFNAGQPVRWAFPHTIGEVDAIGRGHQGGSGGGAGFTPQLAVLVRPTPLEAVRTISREGLLMPQKSTFFYPKLATGLLMHLLR